MLKQKLERRGLRAATVRLKQRLRKQEEASALLTRAGTTPGTSGTPDGQPGYWHPGKVSFTIALAIMAVLLAVLVRYYARAPQVANRAADILLAAATLYGGVIGIRGGTWDDSKKGLDKLTWAGGMIVLGVAFAFLVAVVQKFPITDKLDSLALDATKAAETKAVASREKELAQLRDDNKVLQGNLDGLKKDLDERAKAESAARVEATRQSQDQLNGIKTAANNCPKEARDAIATRTQELQAQLYVSTVFISSGVVSRISAIGETVDTVNEVVTAIKTSSPTSEQVATGFNTLAKATGSSGDLARLVQTQCSPPTLPPTNPVPLPSASTMADLNNAPPAGGSTPLPAGDGH